MSTIAYYLYDDRMVYVGEVDLDVTDSAPPLSTMDAPADPAKVGTYQRVAGTWVRYKAPKPEQYTPSADPFDISTAGA